MLATELDCPHVISVIDTTQEWFYRIHPERYVPALRDEDPESKEEIVVFEGTACLQYLAAKFDKKGDWTGRTLAEQAKIMTWTAYQTAGIGWVFFREQYACTYVLGDGESNANHVMMDTGRQRSTGCTFSKGIPREPTLSHYQKQ